MRVGMGYDVHRLVEDRPLIIGGVTIPHSKGLAGHSDADVLLHAIADALLGAAALGDIGAHFPDTEEEWERADSLHCSPPWARSCRMRGSDSQTLMPPLRYSSPSCVLTSTPCGPTSPMHCRSTAIGCL